MANFEGLIRQALERQETTDPAIREKIYEASRNALASMVAKGGQQPHAVIQQQRAALEDCIERIEAGYRSDIPQPEANQTSHADSPATAAHDVPHIEPNDDFPFEKGDAAPNSPAPGRRTMLAVSAFIPLLAIVGLLIYWLVVSVGGTGVFSGAAGDGPEDNGRNAFLTILSPASTGTLQTAGRGSAEIINHSNLEMIRLISLRRIGHLDVPADPILVTLPSGVIGEIAGRRITLEMLARSGGSEPATFAIHCDLGGIDACGRKHYRIGLQPEEIALTIDVPADLTQGNPNFGINTDISDSARLTGKGDPVDIHYARLRVAE